MAPGHARPAYLVASLSRGSPCDCAVWSIAAHLVGHETGAEVIPHDVDYRPSPDAKKVARNLRIIQQLIETEGVGVVEAAKTFGWP